MSDKIAAMVVYLEEEGGEVLVSVEMIGQARKSAVLADALVKDLLKIDWVFMADHSVFTADPPTDSVH